ncbi:MAG: hypothetical protein ACI4OR_02610 [Alphaproteobacteria bacterium]
MADVAEDEIAKALTRLYTQNRQQGHQQKSFSRAEHKKAFEEAEMARLARQVKTPCAVRKICPCSLTGDQERSLMKEFIAEVGGNHPARHTNALEAKPYTLWVQMENGLVYMAAICQVAPIYWPNGAAGETKRQMAKASKGQIRFKEQNDAPMVLADLRQYHARLYPIYPDNKIRPLDYLGIRWKPNHDIRDIAQKPELSWQSDGAFRYLCTNPFDVFIDALPPHIHALLGQVQKVYDGARADGKIGPPVYGCFDFTQPVRGKGWSIPLMPGQGREYFDLPAVRVVSPRPLLRAIPPLTPKNNRIKKVQSLSVFNREKTP